LFNFTGHNILKYGIIASAISLLVLLLFLKPPFKLIKFIPYAIEQYEIDSLEFGPGHPLVYKSALEQLKQFPLPQFRNQHQLMPNFLWMDPSYLGGLLQPNYKMNDCVDRSTAIQAELAENFHYYFLVNTNLKVYKTYRDTNKFAGAWVKYANEHPQVPIAAISFWAQIQPFKSGGNCQAKLAYVYNNQHADSFYVHDSNGKLISRKYPSPLMPLEALACDFVTQSMYVDSLLMSLKRPLAMINENAEVFRLYEDDFLEQDIRIAAEKKKYPKLSWNEFQALKRLEKEIAYRNSFMQKKELANCLYTEYAIDGQNKYRHDYKTVRIINSKINNQYYSTPDFYPRYPNNWKDWQGPWHGLKWLEICRKTEIDLGDNLFSPFVAAGWDSVETNNIRPAQWLGLLKILGAMGAEYYYSGFFNTGKSVAKPENYVWQAAMPAYAQAITSFYEDILRNGKMINVDHFIQYPKNDVPVVIRKSNHKKICLIACTWQTGSNSNKNIGFEKKVEIDLGHKKISVNARRQGSVYIYSEESGNPCFYQLDAWHEYMHPWFWNKNIRLEAELYSENVITETAEKNDYSHFISAALMDKKIEIPFETRSHDNRIKQVILILNNTKNNNKLLLSLNEKLLGKIELSNKNSFTKYVFDIPAEEQKLIAKQHFLKLSVEQAGVKIDRIEIVKN
jgi:hypothetical protein